MLERVVGIALYFKIEDNKAISALNIVQITRKQVNMLVDQLPQKPNKIAFFLDIDGVLNPEDDIKAVNAIHDQWKEKAGQHSYTCSGCVNCGKIKASLFPKSATSAFESLVAKVSKIAELHIIISSSWRMKFSTNELCSVFGEYQFAKYIIDKTTEEEDLDLNLWRKYCVKQHRSIFEMPEEMQLKLKNYELDYKDLIRECYVKCRGSEIQEWLQNHPDYIGYLVFDDYDSHLSENFGENYICTQHETALLTEEDCNKAFMGVQRILQKAQK